MSFPQFRSWDSTQYPETGQIFWNVSQIAVYQRILTSRILGSLQILSKIPAKPQVISQSPPQRIIIKHSRCCSPNHTYKEFWPEKEIMTLKCMNIQLPREFKTYRIYRKFVSINNHPTRPVGCYLVREIRGQRDKKFIRWLICYQLVLGYLTGWPINPNTNMVYFLTYHWQ